MIFETKNQDLILRVERVLEVEKGEKRVEKDHKSVLTPILIIRTIDTTRTLLYDKEDKRDEDYNNLKPLMEKYSFLSNKINELGQLL